MGKRSLIMYFTMTGNTTKVVNKFQEVFQRRGWECDILKLDRKTDVAQAASSYDCSKYDLFCFGSGVYGSMPDQKIIGMMRGNPADVHYNPRRPPADGANQGAESGQSEPAAQSGQDPQAETPPVSSGMAPLMGHRKLVVAPEWKKGIVFVTFAGHEFGWPEAVPALEALALEMAHMKIQCIGKFSCPGRFGPRSDIVYFRDLYDRPNEKDLQSAEIFLERTLDEIE